MKRSIISVLFPLLFSATLHSLPVSSFIITPEGEVAGIFSSEKSIIRIESGDEDFSLPQTPFQKTVSEQTTNERKSITILTGKYNPIPVFASRKLLENTPYLNTDRKSIRETAARFRKSHDPVSDISMFVYRHINDKKIGIPFLPADSILSGRAGDCTEHTILTVSLLRTLKIPARAVVGVILAENFSGRKNVFVYHMWAEAYYGGRWRLADSTRPASTHTNRYIALAYHNLKTEMPLDYFNAISTMQEMKIICIE